MNSRSKSSFSSPMVWALALACSMVWIGGPSAQAQFNRAAALLPSQIERMVLARGDKLTGPVVRRGPVYLANVLGREDDPERLVIDARSGRLLQRYPGEPAIVRQAAIPESVSPLTTLFDGWFGRHDDVAPPSPSPDILETPKLKPQVKRHKPEPMAVALPTPAPNDNKTTSPVPSPATPIATDAKAVSASPPSPVAAVAPNATTPKAPASKINDVPVAPLE
jgi:hypothetical protein